MAWFSDDNSSLGFVLVLLALGWFGWALFSQSIFDSPPFRFVTVSSWQWLIQGLALALPLLAFQLVIEWRGWRTGLILALFLWVVPPLAAIILGASGRMETVAIYIACLSGPLMPVYAIVQPAMEAHRPGRTCKPKSREPSFSPSPSTP